MTGAARLTIAGQVKKAQVPAPPLPRLRPKKKQQKRWEMLELAELWTFARRRKRKIWLWLAVERASRRSVAWTLGNRGEASARRLWQLLPKRYRRHGGYFTGEWKAYAKVLPRYQHQPRPKGEGQTSLVEASNCSLRQRGGVLVRKSYSCSKCLKMHSARIKIIIDSHKRNSILD